MKVNLNDRIKVKLTPLGKKQYQKYYEDNLILSQYYSPPKEDAEGWSEWTAWDFMSIFGKHMHNGFSIPCETEIEWVGPQ